MAQSDYERYLDYMSDSGFSYKRPEQSSRGYLLMDAASEFGNRYGGISSADWTAMTSLWRSEVVYGKTIDQAQADSYIQKYSYNPWLNTSEGQSTVAGWRAEEKKVQDDALAAQQAALQKQQQDAEKQKQEQAVALAAQQAALEKQRKETEFKTALDAMNQRSGVKPSRVEEVGAINATEDEQKKKKNKRIGYDATKVSGLLGTPNTERKQLLGV